MTAFAFPRQTLEFLAALREHNDREWFQAHRDDYEDRYVEPGKAFVEAVEPILAEIAPDIVAEPRINGSIFRINRDTRFSKDKRAYKDHLDFRFWEDERTKQYGFYVRVTPEQFALGAGAHHFDKPQLERFRDAVADPVTGAQLAQIAQDVESAGLQLGREHYKRHPRGYPDDGPAARFLRFDALHVFHALPARTATDPKLLLPTCQRIWRRLAPLQRWLVDNTS